MKYALYILIFVSTLYSCKKDDYLKDPDAHLTFSVDTIQFDTLFTGFSSITKRFKVYNNYDADINISYIGLGTSATNYFRLNIDGRAQNSLKDYTLRKKDSLFIFVELTIDQSNENNPILVSDSIRFELNNNQQFLPLLAWGQNAHFYKNTVLEENTEWVNDKPYLIYGNLVIDTNAVLTINAGAKVFLHRQSSIVVGGSIHVNGTVDKPVAFNTDRLEEYYQDKTGQWGTIVLLPGSDNNSINYATINAATAGLQIGSIFDEQYANLTISNTRITNTSGAGIYAFGGEVRGYNLLIHSFDAASVVINSGGDYAFVQSTFANEQNSASAGVAIKNPFIYENYQDPYTGKTYDIPFGGDLTRADFVNCILQGGIARKGILIVNEGSNEFSYKFKNCIIYAEPDTADLDIDTADVTYFEHIYWTDTVNFVGKDSLNFRLDSNAVAIDKGTNTIFEEFPEALFDLEGQARDPLKPDIGAFEFRKQ